MKSILTLSLFVILAVVMTASATAQSKIGWINSAVIMEKLPEAQDAQHELDKIMADWQAELAKMQNDWKRKFEEYDKKKLIMTDQLRADAEKELQDLDKKIADFRTQKFGQSGELFNKQNELMKPIQNKIFKVLDDIAKEEEYDYIFDKSGDILLMYTNEKHNLTETVLQRLQSFGK